MANMTERYRLSCPIYHVGAFIVKYDDGTHVVKCGNKKVCGDSCPYLKNSNYKSPYKSYRIYYGLLQTPLAGDEGQGSDASPGIFQVSGQLRGSHRHIPEGALPGLKYLPGPHFLCHKRAERPGAGKGKTGQGKWGKAPAEGLLPYGKG